MKIITAKTAGFCFGVRRAVRITEETAEKYGTCVCLGSLIHNKDVVRALSAKGVHTVESVDDVKNGETVIIRSHGAGKDIYDALDKKHAIIVDATCPDVARIHELVSEESKSDRLIIIFGQRHHPEVLAIKGWCKEVMVLQSPEETEDFLLTHPEIYEKPITIVCQTTAERDKFELSVKLIKKQCTNLRIFDTICNTTSKRQCEAAGLAAVCDAMIVIGGRNSANTGKLYDICSRECSKVFFIENADELNMQELTGIGTVGITAGASTPEWIIKEVNRKMSDEIMTAETVEKIENNIAEEQANTSVDEAADVKMDAEASFEELLERSIKTLHTGEKVSGVIASISQTEISVDLGTKQSGYIPVSEFTDDPSVKVEDMIKVGDEIEAYVMRVNDVEGTVMLSKKRLDSVKAWDNISDARNSKSILEGTVVEENKGGIVVNVKGVRVFVPASQSGLPKDAAMTELLKKRVKLRITEVNQPRRRVVGSIRAVAFEERRARAEQIWNEIEVGKKYRGTVKSLTSYGAFVDIGGIDGMVHVSELSWNRIHKPADVLKVGDELDVYVISFDKENRKISLGYKDPNENPWVKFTTNYDVGSVVDVKIVKLMPFGAFAEILPGVDGLIHISQIADRRIGKPDDVLSEGQNVQAKIINIDNDKQKVSLSIRAITAPETVDLPTVDTSDSETEDSAVVYDTDNKAAYDAE